MDSEFESVLFLTRECYLYRVRRIDATPTNPATDNFTRRFHHERTRKGTVLRAGQSNVSWLVSQLKRCDRGDMGEPLWQGRMRVMERGDGVPSRATIQLEDVSTGELFASAPYAPTKSNPHGGVEAVLDSSRYFVLTIIDVVSRLPLSCSAFRRRIAMALCNPLLILSFTRRDLDPRRISDWASLSDPRRSTST